MPPDETIRQVEGLVVEVGGRNIVELESLRLRTPDGKVWTFTPDGPLAFSSSHLREHQLLGQSIVVSYIRRGEVSGGGDHRLKVWRRHRPPPN